MRRRTIGAGLVLAVVSTCSVTCFAVPEWVRRNDLDFWDHTKRVSSLRIEEARSLDLESERDRFLRRSAACDQIVLSLCERRLSLRDALDELLVLARSDPRWWANLRDQYRNLGLPPSASDREALTLLLRMRIQRILATATHLGDSARVSLVAERLASFDAEVREMMGGEKTLARTRP
ncbi:SH3 domain-containing protein [Frigoriglobus tundricola]|uniref:Uncharacterized protein n=1 Tax=Frigoriglobus tundricola TaxID=2774151 RepID=A0A6M5Z447_9BACT|nr:hypothetical protein [Frigoriglobus tundricola]QJX00547.1 hypothetical protein FTUN_8177 [Frigoriglobus tundricola]